MNCPVDNTELRITERQGIEIDYCPQCRGVWLDRGELDKILDRSAQPGYQSERERYDDRPPRYEGERDRYDDRPPRNAGGHGHHDDYGRRRRKRSFLEDLLDFD